MILFVHTYVVLSYGDYSSLFSCRIQKRNNVEQNEKKKTAPSIPKLWRISNKAKEKHRKPSKTRYHTTKYCVKDNLLTISRVENTIRACGFSFVFYFYFIKLNSCLWNILCLLRVAPPKHSPKLRKSNFFRLYFCSFHAWTAYIKNT